MRIGTVVYTGIVRVLVIIAMCTLPTRLTAHHAYTTVFDASKEVRLTGTLTKVDWRNPHIEMSLDVKTDGAAAETWIIEGGPPSFFSRNKISKDDFQRAIGQTVTLQLYRARNGDFLGSLLKITFADGKSLASEPSA